MSFGQRFNRNFDQLAYQGTAPTHLYVGHEEWDAFREYVQPMERYSVACCEPPEGCNALYRGVKIIHVILPTHWRFVHD